MQKPDAETIAQLAPQLRDRRITSRELVERCLERIHAGRDLNAFITVLTDDSLAQADACDGELRDGCWRGPLHGVPVSVKDLIDVAGVSTTSGSAVPAYVPHHDAPVVRRLREAGAIIIGKTNLHEFAFGTTGDETAFGAVRHPYDHARSAGGSSSGAAVALVERMCYASIGTDTGGSVRIPAAACGTVGLKAGAGEIPTDGVVPLSTTCDHVGPLTRSAGDARILYDALRGTASPRGIARDPLTFGVPRGYLLARLQPAVRTVLDRAIDRLGSAGHHVRDVAIEDVEMTPDVYLHIVLAEAAEYHSAALRDHADRYSPGVRLRLEMGRYVLAEDYIRAQRLRKLLTAAVHRALDGCDALLLPALPITAPALGASTVEIDGAPEPVRAAMLRLTQPFNLTGHPAIALPAGRSDAGLPVGLQLVGHHGRTAELLDAAERVERHIDGGSGSVGGGTG